MSPVIVEQLTKLQLLEQATTRINGQQAGAASGAQAHAAAQAELAEKSTAAARALEVGAEAGKRFGEEFVAGAARIGASLISFELIMGTYEKITEAAREAEVANRQLTARFGAAAGEYREFSEQAAAGTNFTAVQFERASATLQPLIRDYGLTDEQIKELLGTTADLAAANRIDLVQASTDVVGVMRGMTRAGAELGLNLRTNVIASMDGLSDSEKKAVAEGDTLGGAQARLHAIMLESAGAHGQAAAAAAETGDQFARLDGATAKLYETMADSSPVGGLASDLADAATSGRNLILIIERLDELDREAAARGEGGTPAGNFVQGAEGAVFPGLAAYRLIAGEVERQRAENADHFAAIAAAQITSAQATGMGAAGAAATFRLGVSAVNGAAEAAQLAAVQASSAGAAYRDEMERALQVEAAMRTLTRAQVEAARTGEDFRDETNRAIEAQRSYGTELERSAQKVADLDNQLKGFESNRSQIGGLEKQLIDDRATRRRLGLPELPGETDAIRQLYKAGYSEQLAEGPTALAAALAHLKLGDWDPSKVAAEHADVTIANANITVQGGAGGGGQQSSISGGGSAARYAGARSNGPAYQSGLGRFGQ